jgi:hypothetical protein
MNGNGLNVTPRRRRWTVESDIEERGPPGGWPAAAGWSDGRCAPCDDARN